MPHKDKAVPHSILTLSVKYSDDEMHLDLDTDSGRLSAAPRSRPSSLDHKTPPALMIHARNHLTIPSCHPHTRWIICTTNHEKHLIQLHRLTITDETHLTGLLMFLYRKA